MKITTVLYSLLYRRITRKPLAMLSARSALEVGGLVWWEMFVGMADRRDVTVRLLSYLGLLGRQPL